VNVEVLGEQHFYLHVGRGLQTHLEEARLLVQEPLAELFVAAVGKAINEVGDGVVAAEL
jgi:hypothetical protein